MDFEQFRRTGELSDVTIIVDQTEHKLHKFPLFTKSDFFKKALSSSDRLDLGQNFPGGKDVFGQVADYLYSIPITIDEKNLIPLRLAACFIQCPPLANFVDQQFDDYFLKARVKSDLTFPLDLLDQCSKQDPSLMQQTSILEKCLECLVEALAHGAGLQLSRSDREHLVHLPFDWILRLIQLCPKDSKLAILPLVKHYLTSRILDDNDDQHHSEEKKTILDEMVKVLGNDFEQYPLAWLNSLYEKAIVLKCECEPVLSSMITHSILSSADLDDSLEKIPDQTMARLLERVSRNKEEHIKDAQSLAKLSTVIDSYVEKLRQRGELTSEQFVRLASCIPKEQRSSHDSLLRALDEILKDEKSTQLSSLEREELLNQIDFSRVSEETIVACRTNKLIPQQMITDAALSLCSQLRAQLDDTLNRLRLIESQLARTRTTYTTSSSNYRSRTSDTSYRLPSRTRSTYTTNYDLLRNPPISTYSRYDTDFDYDRILPTRYLSSASSSRYGSIYSSYRYA